MSSVRPEKFHPSLCGNLAHVTWPCDWVDEETFIRYLAERTEKAATAVPHLDDLYLACALAFGVPGALAVFEKAILQKLKRSLLQMYKSEAFVDDVCQSLRERLFVRDRTADRTTLRIADYQGRAPLRSWVRVIASRLAVDMYRREQARHECSQEIGDQFAHRNLADALIQSCSQELELIRAQYLPELKSAISAALFALSDDSHNLLRLHYMNGLTLSKIGQLLQKEPSTILRRLTKARAEVYESTHRILAGRLKVSVTEFDSLLRALGSKLEISRV